VHDSAWWWAQASRIPSCGGLIAQ